MRRAAVEEFLEQEIQRIQRWMVSRSKEWLNPCELKNDDDVLSIASYLVRSGGSIVRCWRPWKLPMNRQLFCPS